MHETVAIVNHMGADMNEDNDVVVITSTIPWH